MENIENIVLVGRTGNGKSATGNSIIGKHVFESKAHAAGVTMECKAEIVQTLKGAFRVIDTPGLFDLTSSAEYISKEIVNCLHLAKGGLHAVLLVISVRNRVTKEEEVVLSTLQVLFGSKIVDNLIVVFTGGDELDEDGETIDSYLKDCPDFLKKLLEKCEQRLVVFDNKTKDEVKKKKQVQELLKTIDTMVITQKNYKPYTEEMYHKIQEEAERHKREQEEHEKKKHMHTEEEFEELRKELQETNEQNLKAMAEMMEKNIKMVTEAQQKLFEQREKAEEERHHADEAKHQQEMQSLLSQMEEKHRKEMEDAMKHAGGGCMIL